MMWVETEFNMSLSESDRALWDAFWRPARELTLLDAGIPAAAHRDTLTRRKATARAALITRYTPTTPKELYYLTRLKSTTDEAADQIGLVFMAINSCIDKFDGRVKFETFILQRVRGEILDAARRRGWAPRIVIKEARALAKKEDAFQISKGYKPTEEELGDSWAKRRIPITWSTDTKSRLDNKPKGWAIPEHVTVDDPDRQREELLAALTTNATDREIIRGYYFEDLSMREIGAVLGYSESRVSQLHGRLMERLRSLPRVARLLYDHITREAVVR